VAFKTNTVKLLIYISKEIRRVQDIKEVIRIHKSKDIKHNDQTKMNKKTNNDIQNIHIKLKIE